jgi:hypothetical protein
MRCSSALDCKSVVEPLARLQCYDVAAVTLKTKSLREELSQTGISILETPAAAAAIVAAILALISGIAGPIVQLKIGRRQAEVAREVARASQLSAEASMLTARNAGNREIARLRMGWIDKVRDVLSNYHAILMHQKAAKGDLQQKLLDLGTQLDLLLDQNDKLQKALWDVADKIFKTDDIGARRNMDTDLIAAGRAVFDGEWKKIKAEMKGEEFQTGE